MKIADGSSLNEEQKQAVEYNKGPLLIIAGAGTGKTHVIAEKIKYLIKKNLAKPEQILALTFTNKAAFEMEERVDRAIPYGYFQMWISTFHSFADQILKIEASHIGLNPDYRLLTEAESVIFLRQNLFLFDLKYFRPLGNPNKFIQAILKHFSRLKDEDISPNEYIKWISTIKKIDNIDLQEKAKYLELANAYQKYQQLKIREGLMDFSDQIFYLLILFRQRDNILKKYRSQFRYVLVDEFQDTNIAQYSLLKLICPAKINPMLTLVGDDSQSIYKFRGASVSNILSFMKDYPQARQITLRKNYRSNQTILDHAYKLIKHNDPDTLESKLGISKNLIAQKENDKQAINFYLADKIEDEADYVANQIIRLNKHYQFSDFALLFRANNHADAFVRTFLRKGLPYQFLGPGMLLKQPEVKDFVAYLKFLSNLEDSVSLYRVLTMTVFDIDAADLSFLLSFAKKTNLTLFQTIEVCLFSENHSRREKFSAYKKYQPWLKEETKKKLISVYNMITRHLSFLKKETAGQILYHFLEDTSYLVKLVSYQSEKEEKIALNVSKFFEKLKTFETDHRDASVFAVVDFIEMSMELGESPIVAQTDISSYNAVNLLTVHSAKGLEFPVVFLVNLTRGRFPTYERDDPIPIPLSLIKEILPEGDFHLEEERRLFYVGLTRAKDKVYLSASKYYGEGKRERRISPFVIETLGEDLIKKTQILKLEEKAQLSIFDFKKTEEKIIKNNFFLDNFSFTQLETYERCPLQYKYQHILKIPTISSAPLSFGNTIHKTLQKFYYEFINNKKIKADRLLQIFHQEWIPLGYASKIHQERMKKEGEKMLRRYFKKFHHLNIKIIDIEKVFKIKIANNIFITGKIDRIDLKNKDEIEIIDYKTGKKPDSKELQKSLQLSIYILAASNQGLYQKKLNKIVLTFYYLQETEKISLKKTEKEIIAVKEKIIETVNKIRQNEFFPRAGSWCDFCAFRMICEAWQV